MSARGLRPNRSMPASVIIPVLAYRDVREAVEWLCRAFGFTERLRIGDHRAQLAFGDGAVVVAAGRSDATHPTGPGHSVMVRVADVDAHYRRARDAGASIIGAPSDYPYGERQYTAEDLGGHLWTFSQSTADVSPEVWGGVLMDDGT